MKQNWFIKVFVLIQIVFRNLKSIHSVVRDQENLQINKLIND